MSKKIVAIGGGENGRILENGEKTLYETEIIDREIIRLTEKEKPNFLFINHAMSFSKNIQESYFATMKKIYGDRFGCDCKHLDSEKIYDQKQVDELLEWADIIYEGGGDTSSMIKLWKETNFDKKLRGAWEKGKVICGISAGAVCWFKSCNSDCDDSNFEIVNCLDWFNIFATPHCDEPGRMEIAKNQLKNINCVGLFLSNCSAIEIIDDKYKVILASGNNRNFSKAYVCKGYWKDNNYYEFKINNIDEFNSLKNLLKKE